MGTNCAPLVADLFLFCYERDIMLCLSDNNQADVKYVLKRVPQDIKMTCLIMIILISNKW